MPKINVKNNTVPVNMSFSLLFVDVIYEFVVYLFLKNLGSTIADAVGSELAKSDYYYEMLGTQTITRARNWSNIVDYHFAGVKEYMWLTMGDERVCIICASLDGTIFVVRDSIGLIDEIMDTDDDIRNVIPWIGFSAKRDKEGDNPFYYMTYVSNGGHKKTYFSGDDLKNSKFLSKINMMFGEAHGGCRCTTVPL